MLKKYLLSQDEILEREYEIYNNQLFDNSISQFRIFNEYDFNMPQTLFFINNISNNRIIFGRKILSDSFISKKTTVLNNSLISYNMLFGELKYSKYENRLITIGYRPFSKDERNDIFNEIVNNLHEYEIVFPYRFKFFDSNEEQKSDSIVWSIDEEMIKYLNDGEKHFRDYNKEILEKYNIFPKKVYDPACSTGCFLKSIKDIRPDCTTIGHDLSQEMVNYSRAFVDKSLCVDANQSPITNNEVDLLLLRFLNGGVVTEKDALKLLKLLLKKVKPGGYSVIVGHTPILINQKQIENESYEVLERIGYEKTENKIFQYYLAKRKGDQNEGR